jgi:teichuronic acid biosynthesis glycosyltransferase TuaC
MIRLLTFTNLYPNPAQPRHGIFVEHRLRRLVATGQIGARVIAPAPWCPLPLDARYPEYRVRDIPEHEERDGIAIDRPRYWVVPGLTSRINPWSMMRASMPIVRELLSNGHDFDVVDAQFIYPDGIAGVMIARKLGKPVTLTARGSDVNVALHENGPRKWFDWAKQHVSVFIAVSTALKAALIAFGVPEERIEVIRNGVDLELFSERDREATRREWKWSAPILLSVGNLVEGKGHHIVIEALRELTGCNLIVIGKGPEAPRLRRQAQEFGLAERVRFVEHVPQSELAKFYSAADITVLASSREGMPNVVLESIACGTPVVATAVGGASEIITASAAGTLVHDRSASGVATAIRQVLDRKVPRSSTREFARQFGWDEPIARQVKLFERVARAA